MRIGIFTDPHINKKIQMIQADWKQAVDLSFEHLCSGFRGKVDMIICGGDFFDKALIEAWSLKMIMNALDKLNSLGVPVYFLLGNHEIESETENIIEFLDIYDNLVPITSVYEGTDLLLIPYSDNPEDHVGKMKDKIVFTHHDIFGSSLAAGRSRAKFGIDPKIFKDAKLVINGHIHSRSSFLNVRNIGSFLCGAQGELRAGEHPQFYILDSDTLKMFDIPNSHAIHHITLDHKNLKTMLDYYGALNCKLVVRYEYEDEKELKVFDDEISKSPNVLRHNLRRLIDYSSLSNSASVMSSKSMLDIPMILSKHVDEDPKVPQNVKNEFSAIGKVLLDKGMR
jgi:DNA repair exonuclease SbcCD nuclease subunit